MLISSSGCLGSVARCLKSAYPEMKVTLADLPAVIEVAQEQFPPNKGVDMGYEGGSKIIFL